LQAGYDRAGWIIGRQFLRSPTSVGANAEEAQGAESRRDLRHRYSIARKELRECRFWLRVLLRTGLLPRDTVEPFLAEASELYAILTAIIRRTES
jgi:four helix bundle protein